MQRLEFYAVADLERIVTRSAGILGVPIDADGARRIAQRSRGTPRIANRLLRRVRDFAQVKADGRIDEAVARAALDLLEVDPQGFDTLDRKFLPTIIEKFDGGPVGIESIAAAIGEERGTLEDVIEPFLIQQGFLMRTARGRMATRSAYLHFGLQGSRARRSQPAAVRGRQVTSGMSSSPGARASTGKIRTAAASSTTPTTSSSWSAPAPNGCARWAMRRASLPRSRQSCSRWPR